MVGNLSVTNVIREACSPFYGCPRQSPFPDSQIYGCPRQSPCPDSHIHGCPRQSPCPKSHIYGCPLQSPCPDSFCCRECTFGTRPYGRREIQVALAPAVVDNLSSQHSENVRHSYNARDKSLKITIHECHLKWLNVCWAQKKTKLRMSSNTTAGR